MITNGFSREKLEQALRERRAGEKVRMATLNEPVFLDDPVGRIYRTPEGEYIVVLLDSNLPYAVQRFSTFGSAFAYLDSIEAGW